MKERPAKARSDSLYARCSPEQREELLVFLVELGGPYNRALKMLEEWGVRASLGSLSRFVSEHGMDWRLKRAAQLAADAEGKLPAEWEKSRKLAMAQKEFELAFRDLSLGEYVALERLELDKNSAQTKASQEDRKIAISQEKLKQADRRIKLLEANAARASEAMQREEKKGGITPETRKLIESVLKGETE